MTSYNKLYAHQKRGVDLFLQNPQAFANFNEPGCGKSAQVIVALEILKATKVLIVCPNVLKLTWQAEFGKWATLPWHVAPVLGVGAKRTKIIEEAFKQLRFALLINYEALITKDVYKQLAGQGFNFIIADECFPYNTKIKTDIGLLPIGEIVEQNKATKVLSCDILSGELRWQRIKKRIANKSKENFLRIKHEFGEIICTENHKIFTLEQGYKNALEISAGQSLLFLQNNLSGVFKKRSFLWQVMFSKMENETARNQKIGLFKNGDYDIKNNEGKICDDDKRTENCGIKKDDQAILEHSDTRTKGQGNTKRCFDENKRRDQYNKKSWWKRLWSYGPTEIIEQCFEMGNGIFCFFKRFRQTISVALQNRYRKQGVKNSNRDRWNVSQSESEKRTGQKKGCGFKISRVESVQVLERSDIERLGISFKNNKCVYDLEIENDHNYFAENILVSNSHRIKTPKAKTVEALKTLRSWGRWILTGTPMPNGPLDIWSQIDFIKQGYLYPHKIIPKRIISFYMFRKRYADIYTGAGFPVIRKYINQAELKRYIDGISYRVTKDECLDLPDKIFKEVVIELEPGTRKIYDDMADDLFAKIVTDDQFKQVKTISAKIALTKILRLQQITSGFVKTDDGLETTVGSEKIEALKDILDDLPGQNVIIWTRFNFEVEAIKRALEKFEVRAITGATLDKDRQAIVEEFQAPGRQGQIVLVINMAIGGLGLTLTAANHSIYYSRNYSFSDAVQSADRVHRIGQTKHCIYYDLVCRDTIDAAVLKAIKTKQKLADHLTGDDIKRLMKGQT